MNKNTNWSIDDEHVKILDLLFLELQNEDIYRVLDIGTGRTSLQYLTTKFKDVDIVAITYPGDLRKINSIKESINNSNYILVEADISKYEIKEKYDIVLAHLLLGEASKFEDNNFEIILKKLLEIDFRYLVIIDYKEDSTIDYQKMEKHITEHGNIQKSVELKREKAFISKDFNGNTFKGYIIKKHTYLSNA